MKSSLLALVLLSVVACKTEAASTPTTKPTLAVTPTDVAAKPTEIAETGKVDESLLKWRVGRWSLVKSGTDVNEKLNQPGTVACDVRAEAVSKLLGADKLSALRVAISEAYKIKDKRQSQPIFRGLEHSRELVANFGSEEFMIEKMYQSREVITPEAAAAVGRDIPKASAAESSLETIMDIATNPKLCPNIPN